MPSDFLNFLKPNAPLSPVELERKEEEFWHFDIPAKEEVWSAMNTYFSQASPREDRNFWFSYWRWFTDVSWKFFLNRERQFVIEIAMGRQVPPAILLDFDIWIELIKYLAMRTVDDTDMQSLYSKMKSAFLESEAIMGMWQGKEVMVKEAVEEVRFINRPGNTSLEAAEFTSKIKNILYPKGDPQVEKYFFADPDVAVDRFIGLINFFLGIKPENIQYIVDAYIHPDRGATSEGAGAGVTATTSPAPQPAVPAVKPQLTPVPPVAETKKEPVVEKSAAPAVKLLSVPTSKISLPAPAAAPKPATPALPPTPKPSSLPAPVASSKEILSVPKKELPKPKPDLSAEDRFRRPEVEEKKNIVEARGIAASVAPLHPRNDNSKPSPQQIKTQVEMRFKREEDGQFENVEDVLILLDNLAKQHNDPKIAEMLYFDEAEGKFKWII